MPFDPSEFAGKPTGFDPSEFAGTTKPVSAIKEGFYPYQYGLQKISSNFYNRLGNLVQLLTQHDIGSLGEAGGWASKKLHEIGQGQEPTGTVSGVIPRVVAGGTEMLGDIALMAPAGSTAPAVAALLGATSANPRNPQDILTGAAQGGLTVGALQGLGSLPLLARPVVGAGTFGGLAALQGAKPEDIAAQSILGGLMSLPGGRETANERILKEAKTIKRSPIAFNPAEFAGKPISEGVPNAIKEGVIPSDNLGEYRGVNQGGTPAQPSGGNSGEIGRQIQTPQEGQVKPRVLTPDEIPFKAAADAVGAEYSGPMEFPSGKKVYGVTLVDKVGEESTIYARTPEEVAPKIAEKRAQYLAANEAKLASKQPVPKTDTSVPEVSTPVLPDKTIVPEGGTFRTIKPIEERGAGFNLLQPFGSKEQQLARALKTVTDKAPTVKLQERPANAGTVLQHPLHKYGAIPDEFGEITPKYGRAAAEASQLLAKTEIDIRINQGRGAEELGRTVKKLSRGEWKLYNDQVVDAIENPIGELGKSNLPDNVKTVVREIKVRADRERNEIINIKRNELRESFGRIAEQEYRQEKGRKGTRLTPDERAEVATRTEDLLKAEIPDTWGVKDYFRHLHLGDFAILRDGQYIGSAESWSKALPKITENYAANPGESAPNYKILLREFHDPDVVRVSRGRQYKIINDLAKQFEDASTEDVRQILRGKIGARESKRKWAGFLQERTSAPGYEKDVRFVLNYHNRMYNRWKGLYRLQADIQPLLKKIRSEGRDMVASEIEANLAELWGRPQKYKGEWMLRKWAGRLGNLDMTLRLKMSVRYNLLNNLQLFQTGVGTVFGWKDFAWAQKMVRTDVGKGLLDKYGVYQAVQGTGGELGKNYTSAKFRSGKFARTTRIFTSETANQAEAWLSVYKHGKDLGMADQAAADYAFLRGMIYSQFLPLKTNRPRVLRSAIFANTIGKYRNFTIHAVELGTDIGKKTFGKDVPITDRIANTARLGHFFTAQLLLGGTRLITGPVGKLGIGGYLTYKTYKKLEEEHGKTTADLIYFGLPSLINSDWSASVQLIDLPYAESVPEGIGQVVMGPMGGSMMNVAKAGQVVTGYEKADWKQWGRAFVEAFGGTKQFEGLEKVISKNYDFHSPSGKLQFKGELKDALTQMYGSRPVSAAIQSMEIDAYTELFGERNDAINEAVRGNKEAVIKFNAKWPEVAIQGAEITNRAKDREKDRDRGMVERMITTKWGKKEFGIPLDTKKRPSKPPSGKLPSMGMPKP